MINDPRFTDLMQEIKERLHVVDDVINRSSELWGPLAHEFCFLQLRLICECISYACVIVHGGLKGMTSSKYQREYSADKLMKVLGEIHPDFYPQPHSLTGEYGKWELGEIGRPFLTKGDLIKLNGICGGYLHRGSPQKYRYKQTVDELQKNRNLITQYHTKAVNLMSSFTVRHRDHLQYMLCVLGERNAPVGVFAVTVPHDVVRRRQRPE